MADLHQDHSGELSPTQQRTLALVREAGVLRPRDLEPHGIPREHLRRLRTKGLLKQVGRGLYVLPDADLGTHFGLATACKRVPHGVVCLLSALRFHEMTTQAPFEVWMAVDRRARLPKAPELPLRIVRFSGEALWQGVDKETLEGAEVRVYGPAKTVADCFKYRNKIGVDVAVEALRDYFRLRKGTVDDLWKYAGICRVKSVMRPYMEALV
ncbi:MAG: type IV toxin-antitoxin system AbiEi family antitoxin domain-containing protein [Myxococcales bacterium]|nr:type IV toxin-antitoxin system AbiEi family antitoxin domain-containing protein [Myxococcales bacterium]